MVKPCQTQVDDVSILKTDRQFINKSTTVSLPHLVLNSCLPSSLSKVVDDFMDLTHYTVSVMGCMVSLSAGGFRRTKIIWEKFHFLYNICSFSQEYIGYMMFFKIKTQISNLVSFNHIHLLYNYIHIGYTYHSYHQIRVLAALAISGGSNWSNKKRFRSASPYSDARSSW